MIFLDRIVVMQIAGMLVEEEFPCEYRHSNPAPSRIALYTFHCCACYLLRRLFLHSVRNLRLYVFARKLFLSLRDGTYETILFFLYESLHA